MSINTIIVLFLLAASSSARVVQFFRRDYTHFKQVSSFYKIHIYSAAGSDFTDAFQVCHEESSQLFYPKTREELAVVANLSAKFNLNDSDLLVGIRDEFSFGEFVTVDGKSVELNAPLPLANLEEVKTEYDDDSVVTTKIDTLTPTLEAQADKHCVLWNIETGTYKLDYCKVGYTRPFVCRKIDEPEPCPTIDKGYVYEKSLNKCYKLHLQARSWQEASKACYMEGARLLVVDDEAEFKVTRQRFQEVMVTQFYIGIHRISGDLYTVNGERLDENGPYQIWYDSVRDTTEDCVTVKDNYFITCACDLYYPFICEMNAH